MNEEEAKRVRSIFALFEKYGSVLQTLQEGERRGAFALNSLRRLLTNIIYTGSVRHHGKPYPGEHTAILTTDTLVMTGFAREAGQPDRRRTPFEHVNSGCISHAHHGKKKMATTAELMRYAFRNQLVD
jgi:hypothetical protein